MKAAQHLATWAAALAAALLLAAVDPGALDEPDAAQATADDLRDAQLQAAMQLRCDRAPPITCPNGDAP